MQSWATKHFWDDCLELEAFIKSNTAQEIYKFDGEVAKTVMSVKTSNVHQFCELEWFQWITLWDETAPFPDDLLKLGHYLGPNLYIHPAMTTKILTEYGQVFHVSMYRSFTSDQLLKKDGSYAQEQFMVRV